jgi:hypothetical protein
LHDAVVENLGQLKFVHNVDYVAAAAVAVCVCVCVCVIERESDREKERERERERESAWVGGGEDSSFYSEMKKSFGS